MRHPDYAIIIACCAITSILCLLGMGCSNRVTVPDCGPRALAACAAVERVTDTRLVFGRLRGQPHVEAQGWDASEGRWRYLSVAVGPVDYTSPPQGFMPGVDWAPEAEQARLELMQMPGMWPVFSTYCKHYQQDRRK